MIDLLKDSSASTFQLSFEAWRRVQCGAAEFPLLEGATPPTHVDIQRIMTYQGSIGNI